MNYKETIDFLYNSLPMFQRSGAAAYKDNLDNTLLLDKALNSPYKNYKSIHIAGTNGKGSVCNMLASCLQEEGYKVGLFTSPHLKEFNERIRINGEKISGDNIVSFVAENKEIIEDIKPSFFEMTFAMAEDYFAKEKVDIAIFETGMGGRLDSTNIIDPIISVITNISLDHTQFLGDTIQKIAIEKAGIIKQDTPIVIGQKQIKISSIFEQKANENNAKLYYANYQFDAKKIFLGNKLQKTRHYDVYSGDGNLLYQDFQCDLLGEYQKDNIITSLCALDLIKGLGFDISDDNILRGFANIVANTGFAGRWHILSKMPLTVCDTAHNIGGIMEVVFQIRQQNYINLHMVIGFVNDKDIESILALLPKNAKYYFCQANIPRALDANILKDTALKYQLSGDVYQSVELALRAARNNANADDMIYVGGSTFTVAEVI